MLLLLAEATQDESTHRNHRVRQKLRCHRICEPKGASGTDHEHARRVAPKPPNPPLARRLGSRDAGYARRGRLARDDRLPRSALVRTYARAAGT